MVNEVMKWGGGRVGFGIIVFGTWYAIPHSAEVKFLLVINRI
jgi:hypothetical protein